MRRPPIAPLVLLTAALLAAGAGHPLAAAEPPWPAWPPFLAPPTAYGPEVAAAVERVWREPSFRRTVRGRPAPVPFEVYVVFVDTPEITAAAARHLALAPWEVTLVGDDEYVADDGEGARGRYRVLAREARRRVMLSHGEHSSLFLGQIQGSALTVLELEPHPDRVEQSLTAHVLIDNRVAAALARLLIALFGFVADRKLTEGFEVTAQVAAWALEQPEDFCAWLARGAFRPERRARVARALPACSGR